jgi:hypothetical protein
MSTKILNVIGLGGLTEEVAPPAPAEAKPKSHEKAKSLSEMLWGEPSPTATKDKPQAEREPKPGTMEALLFGKRDKGRSEPAYQSRAGFVGSAFAAAGRQAARVNRAGSGRVYTTPTKGPYSK